MNGEMNNMKKAFSASPMQQGMYFHDLLSEKNLYYNQVRFGIKGKLDVVTFEKSIQLLVDTHEALRSRFYLSGEETVMVDIMENRQQELEQVNLEHLSMEDAEKYIEKEVQKNSRKKIDLEKGKIMNMTLYRLQEDYHVLLWGCHHIALDGWCMSILIKELFAYYQDGKKGIFNKIEEVPYSTYLEWLEKNDSDASKEYWKNYLDQKPEAFMFPGGKKEESFCTERENIRVTIDSDRMNKIKKIASQYHITVSTIVQGLWGLLLCKYSNQKEAIWGCVTSGRSVPIQDSDKIVGLFINTMPIIIQFDGNRSFIEQLTKLGMDIFQAEFKSSISLNEISEKPKELFNHIFAFENLEFADMLNGAKFYDIEIINPKFYDRTNYDLTVKAQPSDQLYIEWHYNPEIYNKDSIKTIADVYEYLLSQLVEKPERLVKDYKILTKEQEYEIINTLNGDYRKPEPKTTQQQFMDIVKKYPDNIALSEDGRKITYAEFYENTKKIAAYLQHMGAKQGDIIGIDAEGSLENIQCLIGIGMAGCAYLPLDKKLPDKRRDFYIKQTGMKMLFTDYPEKYVEVPIKLSKEQALKNVNEYVFIQVKYSVDDLMYIIFTSGSTGEPKGVSVTSGPLCRFGTLGEKSSHHGEPTDRVAQIAVLSFDASIYEIFSTFLTGGTLVIGTKKDRETAGSLAEYFKREKINRTFITMQLFQLIVEEDVKCFANMKSVSAGGERASAKHFYKMARANPNVRMVNGYGPTEIISLSSGYWLNPNEIMDEIPLGFPEENHTYYVMDEDGNLCPPMVAGELYIGGGIASGYFGKEEMTRERFIDNPYEKGGKLYKSGDIVKYMPSKGVLYLYRKDNQVKIRGFRIEAGEIENALRECPGIKQGCIKIIKVNQSWKINAYYTSDQIIETEKVKQWLEKQLPSYMMPSAYMQLEKFPINKNGKLDIKNLPDINAGAETLFVLPQTELQQKILKIWQEVLGNNEIGIRHNFFEWGGDSIKAMQIIGLMKKEGLNAEIRNLFQNPTVEKFVNYVYRGTMEPQDMITGLVDLMPIQKYFFSQNYINQNQFNQSALLKMKKKIDKNILYKAIKALVKHHDMLRAKYTLDNGEWKQDIQSLESDPFEIREFTYNNAFGEEKSKQQEWLDQQIENIQKKMSLENGILTQIGFFHMPEEELLFIAVHHLVMDGVSFRIILRDMGELINGILNNETVSLVPKTVSYPKYSAAVNNLKDNEVTLSNWEEIDTSKLEYISSKRQKIKLKNRSTKIIELDSSIKKHLEDYTRVVKGTEFADVLMTIFSKAISDVMEITHFAIEVEHNGRGLQDQKYDVSNTVGWFTSIYPIIFNAESQDISYLIDNMTNMQQKYRKNSAEYMMGRMMEHNKSSIYDVNAEICFNYLGDFNMVAKKETPFDIVVKSIKNNRSLEQETPYLIEMNSLSINEHIQVIIDYYADIIEEKKVDEILEKMQKYASMLGKIAEEKYYEPFPLSSLQMAYFIGKQDFYELGGFTTHNYMEMETTVDIPRLNDAFQKLINQQEMLRTIVLEDGTQQVLKEVPQYKIQMEDISALTKKEQEIRIQEKRNELSHFVFDIHKFPMFDIGGFILDKDKKYLFIGYDTIMLDSGSVNLMIRDLAYNYLHPDYTPEPLQYHYRDYIHDWEHQKTQPIYEEAMKYWESKLENFPEAPQLPMICNPEDITKGHFHRNTTHFTIEAYEAMKRQATKHGMTMSALLLSAYAHTMNYYSGTDKFALNLTIFNRPTFHPDIERLYGDFTSTILLDFDLSEHKSFWKESEKVQHTLSKALEYRIYDGIYFSRDVMRKFHYPKTKAMMPMVFTSLLFEQDIWEDVEKLGEVKWQIGQTPQVYVDFQVLQQAGELVIQMDYVSELFDAEFMERVYGAFCHILDEVAMEKEEIDLPTLTDEEEKQRAVYNDTMEEHPIETTLIELFLKSVKKYPNKVALVCNKQELTYEELDKASDRVAEYLENAGLEHTAIGIFAEREIGTIVNILGILKAGGTYVPMLSDFPQERIDYICKCSNIQKILQTNIYYDLPEAKKAERKYLPSPKDSAYVLYTSGSTGTPKGVEILNYTVSNTIMGANEAYEVGEEDVFIGMSAMSFDMSVYDIFGAFEAGGRLIMVPDIHAIEAVANLVEEYGVTVWQTVPALMQMYMGIRKPGQGSSLRHVLLGGDFIPKQLAKDILEKLPNASFMSVGGPTETSIFDIYYPVHEVKEEWNSIPYGIPIKNQQIYVMDSSGRECPNDVQGEICVGGMGLAKGYVNQPELTAEKFVVHPKYGRIFKTGDYGIFRKEGYVEICGRMDGQVKLQGMRIELGEIENVFLRHPGVSLAVALIHKAANGSKQIVVFLEADEEEFSAEEFMDYAKQYLTTYMRPNILKIMNKLPLSANNKIDRKALLASLQNMKEEKKKIIPPQNEIESKLLEIWKSVLKIEEAGVEDDFFEQGGDSLKAMEVLSEIRSVMNWDQLLLTDILRAGTVRKLAEFYMSGTAGKLLRELSFIQPGKKKVFFIHGGNGSADSYSNIVKEIETHANCYGIDYIHGITLEPKKISLKKLAKEYAKAILEETNPKEEITLVGWCIGGTIAYEIAYILENSGYEKIYLMFLDTQDPGIEQDYAYTKEEELEFIKSNTFGLSVDSLLSAANIHELWEMAIKLIEADSQVKEKVTREFLAQTAGILLHTEKLSIRELIMLNNFFRSTVDSAKKEAITGMLKKTRAVYVQAKENSVAEKPEKWQEHFQEKIEIKTIEGSHFSIVEDEASQYSDWIG